MHCPVCKETQLVMSERQGIEIDYCPSCRGVWLDRGELDKIIERSVQDSPGSGPSAPFPRRDHDDRDDSRTKHGYRKKSFLADLFD